MNKIFDLKNLDDIPQELIRELNIISKTNNNILWLFKNAGKNLNLTELLIGYYRKYDEVKTRQHMMTACYRLMKKGFLQKTKGKGEYKITPKGLMVINYKKVK